ncbi:5'-deoxynucleotidase [Paenibacillus sp. GXUN7292]|uniref:5'-deoxynucleotidase n=1 Tax=Paenibacillus sp. GXUN7292 TaxID=3422499 RepID=UPI003D7D4AB0
MMNIYVKNGMNSFVALAYRLRLIPRWVLMRNNFSENVAEHSHSVAIIAHLLATIRITVFGKDDTPSPDKVAMAATLHDLNEVFIGDLPATTKTYDEEMLAQCKKLEELAIKKLINTLPPVLRNAYEGLLFETDCEIKKIVKAADLLDAYIKCANECASGNREFAVAKEQIYEKMFTLGLNEEIEYFLNTFGECFELTIDELQSEIRKPVAEHMDTADRDWNEELRIWMKQNESATLFLYQGVSITNPFMDETGRYEVDPVTYYGVGTIRTALGGGYKG